MVMLVRNHFTHDTRVEKEARTLTAAGYRVTIVADAAAGLADRERRDAIDVRRVPRRGPQLPGLRFVLHEAQLSRVLRGLRPDILHAHDTNTLIPVAVAAAALQRAVRIRRTRPVARAPTPPAIPAPTSSSAGCCTRSSSGSWCRVRPPS